MYIHTHISAFEFCFNFSTQCSDVYMFKHSISFFRLHILFVFFYNHIYIQSDISKASPKHYFRDVLRAQFVSEEHPVCNIMLPLSSCGLLNISECHLVILLNFYGVLYTPTPSLGVYP